LLTDEWMKIRPYNIEVIWKTEPALGLGQKESYQNVALGHDGESPRMRGLYILPLDSRVGALNALKKLKPGW